MSGVDPQYHECGEFEVNLGYVRLCLKEKEHLPHTIILSLSGLAII